MSEFSSGETAPAIFNHLYAPLRKILEGDISEIAVNQPHSVWAKSAGGWVEISCPDLSFEKLSNIATTLASNQGKPITVKNPFLSAPIPGGGERAQIVIPPATLKGHVAISIRKASVRVSDIDTLLDQGVFSHAKISDGMGSAVDLSPYEKELKALHRKGDWGTFFKMAMLHKLNVIFAGKTDSGKTHIAKAFAAAIPLSERIITIEDVHEFYLHHKNKVHLLFNGESISAKDCVLSCMRMNPDRIFLSEMRGDEAWYFLKAIGSAHPGLTTLHAGSPREAIEQTITLVKDSATGAHLDISFLQRRLESTIDIIVICKNRKVTEVYYEPERKYAALG